MKSATITAFREELDRLLLSETLTTLMGELQAQVSELALPLEGMRDYVRVGNGVEGEDAMRDAASQAARDYQRRIGLLEGAIAAIASTTSGGALALPNLVAALDALEADGYPDVAARAVPREVFEQIAANAASLLAARDRFVALGEEAVGATVRIGAGADKARGGADPQPAPGDATGPAAT